MEPSPYRSFLLSLSSAKERGRKSERESDRTARSLPLLVCPEKEPGQIVPGEKIGITRELLQIGRAHV